LPAKVFESVRKIFYGPQTLEVALQRNTVDQASKLDVEVKSFKIPCEQEQLRGSRVIKVGSIQNKIVLSTDKPVAEQKKALEQRIKDIIELAALEGVNVICLQ
jgi:beta-ureidopropionase